MNSSTPASKLSTVDISIEQLCVGLYVHLDLPWLNHSFARNSFKIRTTDQIEEIRRLGLKTVRYEPERSDCAPLSLPLTPARPAPAEIAQPSAEELALIAVKKARVERLMKEHVAIAQYEKNFLEAADSLKSISRNLFSRPKEAHAEADRLVQQMVESLLADKDIAIHLMNDKIAGEETYYHSLNVSVLAMMLAKEMQLTDQDIKMLGVGCLFHDMGKMEIPDRIVNKTTELSKAEQNLFQMHCHYGETLATKIGMPKPVLDIIAQHHEYADGSGYPNKLKADQISPLARIAIVVNAYDNLCNRPNPADSMSPYEALSFMYKQQRKLYDPVPLSILVRCLGVYPPGSVVQLSDASFAMVLAANPGKPLRPTVLLYDPKVPKHEALIIDLETREDLEIAASLKPKQLSREVYNYLSPRKRMAYYFESGEKPKAGS
jgi:putative nucleotidyltransferase with HDIG domain